jgi:hypothetical protein
MRQTSLCPSRTFVAIISPGILTLFSVYSAYSVVNNPSCNKISFAVFNHYRRAARAFSAQNCLVF